MLVILVKTCCINLFLVFGDILMWLRPVRNQKEQLCKNKIFLDSNSNQARPQNSFFLGGQIISWTGFTLKQITQITLLLLFWALNSAVVKFLYREGAYSHGSSTQWNFSCKWLGLLFILGNRRSLSWFYILNKLILNN